MGSSVSVAQLSILNYIMDYIQEEDESAKEGPGSTDKQKIKYESSPGASGVDLLPTRDGSNSGHLLPVSIGGPHSFLCSV